MSQPEIFAIVFIMVGFLMTTRYAAFAPITFIIGTALAYPDFAPLLTIGAPFLLIAQNSMFLK